MIFVIGLISIVAIDDVFAHGGIDQEFDGPFPNISFIDPFDAPFGQEFVPTQNTLTAIDIFVKSKLSAPITETITLTIREGTINGNVVGSKTLSVKTYPGSSSDFFAVHFDFSPPLNLTPGNKYVIQMDTLENTNSMYFRADGGNNPYPQGNSILTGVPNSWHELGFRTRTLDITSPSTATVLTEKSEYVSANDVDKILITGTLPYNLPICVGVPATPPNAGTVCEPSGAGPSIEIIRPNGNSAGSQSFIQGLTDLSFSVDGLNFSTFEWRSNLDSLLGTYTVRLWSGNGASGSILDTTSFEMVEDVPPTPEPPTGSQAVGTTTIIGTCGLSFPNGNNVNYGNIIPNSISNEIALNVTNSGTQSALLEIRGTDWKDGSNNSIMNVNQTHFNQTSFQNTYNSKALLNGTDGTVTNSFIPSELLQLAFQLEAILLDPLFTGSASQTMDFTVSC